MTLKRLTNDLACFSIVQAVAVSAVVPVVVAVDSVVVLPPSDPQSRSLVR